jgi:hypothetical protein
MQGKNLTLLAGIARGKGWRPGKIPEQEWNVDCASHYRIYRGGKAGNPSRGKPVHNVCKQVVRIAVWTEGRLQRSLQSSLQEFLGEWEGE